jgi:hypothetical protein
MKTPLVLIIFTLFLLGCDTEQKCNRYSDTYIPKDLEDAMCYLDCSWDNLSKEKFKNVQEKSASLGLTPETGMILRNTWGLWQEKTF